MNTKTDSKRLLALVPSYAWGTVTYISLFAR